MLIYITLVQELVALLLLLVMELFATGLFYETLGRTHPHMGLLEMSIHTTICLMTILAGAYLPPSSCRRLRVGRWMWLLPVALFAYVLYSERRFGKDYVLRAMFWIGGPSPEGIGGLFVTMPVVSSILFSLGAAIRYRAACKGRK